MLVAPNIFYPRNDWNVMMLNCRSYSEPFEKKLAREIKIETGFNPFNDVKYRGGQVTQSRQLFLTMMTIHTHLTLEIIGQLVGKDHATVLHAVKSVNNMCDTNKRFKDLYDRINEKAKKLK